MPSSRPASWRRSAALSFIRACWPKRIRSAVTVAVQGSKPITASIATDLPEPDSPTIATISFGAIVKSKPSTALKAPEWLANETERLRISIIDMILSAPPELGIERVAQAITHDVDGLHRHQNGETPNDTIQGFERMNSRASASIDPHYGIGGWAPR